MFKGSKGKKRNIKKKNNKKKMKRRVKLKKSIELLILCLMIRELSNKLFKGSLILGSRM